MNFELTKEEKLIQKMAKHFAEQVIAPAADYIEKENMTPPEVLKGMAELNLFGLSVPEEYGGADAGYICYTLAMEQIARIHPGPAMTISAHSLGLNGIYKFGNEEQRQKYLPSGASGEKLASWAFTEPGTGSDPTQVTTTAVKNGDHYVLNGTKRFITNPNYAGPMVCFAREMETKEITAFIVDKFCEGYSISEQWHKQGWHGNVLCDVYLKDVKVPVENVLGEVGQGYKILQFGIAYGKLGLNSVSLGLTLAAYEEAVKYAQEKMHRGKPIAKFQTIQVHIANIAIRYEASKWVGYRLAALANNHGDEDEFRAEVAKTKVILAENCFAAVRESVDVHASYGLMEDYKIARIYRDAIMGPQSEGVIDIQKIILAHQILGKI
ncbi:MAG TPA: acyl-CoA dehydrogenase family protein [Syntrophomonas sp.]|nr:acyl-CoA dehydrogenase family protein [Syntrophomonas sp.]